MENDKTMEDKTLPRHWPWEEVYKVVENTADYYVHILKACVPYLESLLAHLELKGGDFKETEDLVRLLHTLKSETYGRK